jgi:excisionase family DNA binding protein
MSKLLTIREAAGLLGLSISKVYRMTWTGELYSQRIGRAVRIPESTVKQLTEPAASYIPVNVKGEN